MAPVGTPFALYIKTNCVKKRRTFGQTVKKQERKRKENREKAGLDVKV